MWARYFEMAIGVFLAFSSIIFPIDVCLWKWNVAMAIWLFLFSLLSFYFPLRKIHLLNVFVIIVLIALAFKQPVSPPAAPYQNYVVLALLLVLFVIIPTNASKIPVPWERFYSSRKGKQ